MKKRNRVLVYGVPLLAVLFVGTAFALNLSRPPLVQCSVTLSQTPAMDFTVSISIQVQNREGNASRFIIPPGIGIPGGIWASHLWDRYGIDGRSPVCTDQPTGASYGGISQIHVRSLVSNVTFTLGDFFALWGQPIGPNATFNSAYVFPNPNFHWQMCIGNPKDTSNIKPGHWGNETLIANKFITLIYFPVNGNGCLG